ncbi:acyltransferase family protein [Solilutibacter silvestris]|uniref:Acyltransferase family n=1 Tax=Solilutibacter silvestris TaxID=1645665 RepID=A0A2K1Q1H5_9GAMM|nr:acyltransferase [Lysobacter silvestris]PNS08898.1 Acyltransferase family [Lysobacter silvestris]
MNARPATAKIAPVEAIRGLACLQVVCSHFALVFWPWLHAFWGVADPDDHPVQRFVHDSPFAFLYSGSAAVFIFFVLSGFILSHVAIGRSPRDIFGLVLKRYPRLALPCIAACVFAWAVIEWMNVDYNDLSVWIQGYGDFPASFLGALRNGAWEVFVTGQSRYNPILWTMRIELWGSWMVFALCIAFTRWPKLRAPLLLIATAALAWLGASKLLDEEMTYGLVAFVIGIGIQLYVRRMSVLVSILVLAAGLYFAGVHNTSASYLWMQPLLGEHAYMVGNFISGGLIVAALLNNALFAKLAATRPLMFLGKVSFSVYLIHLCIVASLAAMIFNALQARDWDYDVSAITACAIVLPVIYLAATVFHRFVDSPAITFSNKVRDWLLPRRR